MNSDLGVWTYDDCALVLIDYQKEMFEVIRSETGADLVELNVRLLAKTAKAFDMPIVLSTVGVGYGINGPTLPAHPGRAGRHRADRSDVHERFRGSGLPRGGGSDRAQAADHRRTPHRDLPHVRDGRGAQGRLRRDVRHRCRRRSIARPRTARGSRGCRTPAPCRLPRSRSPPSSSATGRARSPARPSRSSTGISWASRS